MNLFLKFITISVLFYSILMCYINVASAKTWQCSFKDGWTLIKMVQRHLSKAFMEQGVSPQTCFHCKHMALELNPKRWFTHQPHIGHAVVEIGSMTLSVSETH